MTDIERQALAGQNGSAMTVEEQEQVQIARRPQTPEPVEKVSHALRRHVRRVHPERRVEKAWASRVFAATARDAAFNLSI